MLNHIVNSILYNSKKYNETAREISASCGNRKLVVASCTKPFQYVNLMNIPLPEPSYKVLCVCHSFIESEAFIESIRKHDQKTWNRILDFKRREDVCLFLLALKKIDFLFTEVDFGLWLAFPMREVRERGCEISCYEEGSSMYCNGEDFVLSVYHPKIIGIPLLRALYKTVRRLTLRLLGSGTWFGRSKWTSHIYTYYPHAPALSDCTDKCLPFPYSLMEQMVRLSYLFPLERVYPGIAALHGMNVLIIALGWNGVIKLNDDDLQKYDRIIVKHHPHLAGSAEDSGSDRVLHMYGVIPTEFLASHLLRNDNRVTLRSQMSASLLYLMGTSVNCEFYNAPPEIFRSIIAYLNAKRRSDAGD